MLAIVPFIAASSTWADAPQTDSQPLVETFDIESRSLPDGWRVIDGNWRVFDGEIVADSLQGESYITFGASNWRDYEIAANVVFRKVHDPSRWLSLLVRATPDGKRPWSQVAFRFDTTKGNGSEFAVRLPSGAWSVRNKRGTAKPFKLGNVRKLKVTVQGTHVQGYIDGKCVVSSHLCVDRTHGCVGLGVSGCVASFDDVTVRQLPPPHAATSVSAKSTTPDIVAHRGYSAVAPENTLAAIREAVRAGATGCEFDVYACADGTVVLMHDKTVDRTTDGKGDVTKLTLQQLRRLDAGSWKDKQYAGERVPTLAEALRLLQDTKCQPVIEIKMEGISKKVVQAVRALDMTSRVAVIAFSPNVVREIRDIEPKITCAWLCGGFPTEISADSVTQQADWLQTQAQECSATILDLNFGMLSPGLTAELKRRDLGVWCWTVNEPVVMNQLQVWGVDSITTDRPDLLHRPVKSAR